MGEIDESNALAPVCNWNRSPGTTSCKGSIATSHISFNVCSLVSNLRRYRYSAAKLYAIDRNNERPQLWDSTGVRSSVDRIAVVTTPRSKRSLDGSQLRDFRCRSAIIWTSKIQRIFRFRRIDLYEGMGPKLGGVGVWTRITASYLQCLGLLGLLSSRNEYQPLGRVTITNGDDGIELLAVVSRRIWCAYYSRGRLHQDGGCSAPALHHCVVTWANSRSAATAL